MRLDARIVFLIDLGLMISWSIMGYVLLAKYTYDAYLPPTGAIVTGFGEGAMSCMVY